MKLFSPKDPDEVIVLAFDFSKDDAVADGAVLSSPTVDVTARKGVDPAAAAIRSGAPQISGKLVLQKVIVGISGVDYELRAKASTSDGQTVVLVGVLPVRRAA